MRNTIMIALYVGGAIASWYCGMQWAYFRMRKVIRRTHDAAWKQGFKSGQNHLEHVLDTKLDLESSVRILKGEQ